MKNLLCMTLTLIVIMRSGPPRSKAGIMTEHPYCSRSPFIVDPDFPMTDPAAFEGMSKRQITFHLSLGFPRAQEKISQPVLAIRYSR